jgi:hypothetical protein
MNNRTHRKLLVATLNIVDAEFAGEQTAIFEADRARSSRVTHAEWLARPFRERVGNGWPRLCARNFERGRTHGRAGWATCAPSQRKRDCGTVFSSEGKLAR